MVKISYDFDQLDSMAQSITSQADTLRQQVESYWKTLVSDVEQMPASASSSTSPSLDDCLSLMIKSLAQMLALRTSLGTQLANASAAAQQCEADNRPEPWPMHGMHGAF